MPSKTLLELLQDIAQSGEAIQDFVVGMSLDEYCADLKTRSAVERQFLIIAEAAKRLGEKAYELCPHQDWRAIRDFGNVIRHDYEGVADNIVWDSIQRRLPELQSDVNLAISKAGEPRT